MIERRYREFDVSIDRLIRQARQEGNTIPCERGCDACCFDLLIVSQFELPPLIEALRKMTPERRLAIKMRLVAWVTKMKAAGLDPCDTEQDRATYYRAGLPCPFLNIEKHECSIYHVRPINCRAHHIANASPAVCANVAEVPTTPMLLIDDILGAYVSAVLGDQKAQEGEYLHMVFALLPTMLTAVWYLVEDPQRSIADWLAQVNREGRVFQTRAKDAPSAG